MASIRSAPRRQISSRARTNSWRASSVAATLSIGVPPFAGVTTPVSPINDRPEGTPRPSPGPASTTFVHTSEQAKAEARAEKERAAEEARFWASPRGQARKAREEGRTWVQIVAPISETRIGTTGFVTGFTSTDARSRTSDQTGLIESVEAEGWKLEHAGYVFQPTSTASRDKLLSSGQTEQIAGKIMGIYLFHLIPGDEVPPPPVHVQ